jgi:hypothetical protein
MHVCKISSLTKRKSFESNKENIEVLALLNFDPVSMHEKCCNRPKIVAIAEIATLFFRWEALQALAWVNLWTTLF